MLKVKQSVVLFDQKDFHIEYLKKYILIINFQVFLNLIRNY